MNRIERAKTAQEASDNQDIKIYSFAQTCALLHVTAPTLLKYLKSGSIVGKKIGGRWFITSDAIQNALDPSAKKRLNTSRPCETTIANASS